MKSTYTQMDVIDGKFVGTVYDSNSNQVIFKTQPRLTQLQATQDINSFLISKNSALGTQTRATIVNTTTFKPAPPPTPTSTAVPRRCCGR